MKYVLTSVWRDDDEVHDDPAELEDVLDVIRSIWSTSTRYMIQAVITPVEGN